MSAAGFGWTPRPFEVQVESRRDGAMLIKPTATLAAYPERVTDRLEYWASRTPDQVLVAQRGNDGEWQKVTYQQALQRVRRIAASLAERQRAQQLSIERPIVIISGNSIEHLLVALAAMYVGIPYSPVSMAYAQAKSDLSKLQHVLGLLTPGMLVSFDASSIERAVAELVAPEVEIVADVPLLAGRRTTSLAQLENPADDSALQAAHAAVKPQTIAKFLLTSGSTGNPKAVITTHRMLCSNLMMTLEAMPFLVDEPPVVIDWLPWNHTFGGSHNVNIVMFNGGSLYIDDGRPVPGGFEKTLHNLKEISPTVYFNVPKGFELLALQLQTDGELRASFFKRLRACFFAGAGLSQHTWDRLNAVALAEKGVPMPVLCGLGATECSPSVTFTSPYTQTAGVVGLPAAGNELKLMPIEGKLELRVKGPHVMPGYWRQPELAATSFDEEGYYRLGDAVCWADPNDYAKGLLFDGRIAEDFKLSTGTWVSVGPLRATLLTALAPLVQDVVIAGLNQEYLAILVFPFWPACAALADLPAGTAHDVLAADGKVIAAVATGLQAHAKHYPAGSTLIKRALLMTEPASIERGEVTDKGSINQRAVLRHRVAAVTRLYAEPADAAVIQI
jgi:feruloyl-CoA synthase